MFLLLGFSISQAEEIAEKLCESVEASLEGKKLASFTRISSTVQVLCFVLVALIESRKHFDMQSLDCGETYGFREQWRRL